MKIDGRCHCGYVTFEAEADPETTTICNCTDCQTMSGAPLRAIVATRPGTFVLLSGKPTEYRKTADSGNVRLQAFCPHSGRRSMRHRLAMRQKPTTCGLDRCANEMNWCTPADICSLAADMGQRPQLDPEIRRAAALTWPMGCELVCMSLNLHVPL